MSDFERRVVIIPARPQAMQEELKRQKRVAAYCRVSTEEEEQQSSYEAQCSYYTDKIMTNPEWTMAGIFADEGISGTSTRKREEFNRMIRKCRQKKIDLILTKSISRFARNTVDCLKYVRVLKELGIGIYFEKENINTLDMDTELILTFMGAFAQSESESISANVRWGKRQAMKEGKVSVNFEKLYGYCVDESGQPQIEPVKGEAVRVIYAQYLRGASLRMIKEHLEEKQYPSPSKGGTWNIGQIRYILSNEKYCGDVLMQKTFIKDCLSKKAVKNTGQLPMYLVQNNHPAIVSRADFQTVQAELARRNASKSPSTKGAPTGRASYASKYALSERLICGECGTLYRRCTWTYKGEKRVVWRCVSRLDYGTKYCHNSPTMREGTLQQAIMRAINSQMDTKENIVQLIAEAMEQELVTVPNSDVTLGAVKRRMQELEEEFANLLRSASCGSGQDYRDRFQAITEETARLKAQQEEISAQLRTNQSIRGKMQRITAAASQMEHQMTEWDEAMIRQLVHTVEVISADRIRVILTDGSIVMQEVHSESGTL
ncbi:MAG: recombinase family protein [Oscillospiraceae bacterium]|nr:recombinase family protein [Oscillospiraceae bacterium]